MTAVLRKTGLPASANSMMPSAPPSMAAGSCSRRESTPWATNQNPWCCKKIRPFKDFDPDNDPYGEHDFCAVDVQDVRPFGKIDYYDRDIRYGADDPSDPVHTTRVLTIMLAEEY